jgi:hypothetical protein
MPARRDFDMERRVLMARIARKRRARQSIARDLTRLQDLVHEQLRAEIRAAQIAQTAERRRDDRQLELLDAEGAER